MELQLDMNKRYTYADYLQWLDEKRRELLNGIVHLMTPAPSRIHQEVSGKLFYLFFSFFVEQNRNRCKVYCAPFDVRLPVSENNTEDKDIVTVVQPDITVVCDPSKLDDKGCLGAPNLIVEIVSPATSKKDMHDKFYIYERAGIKEYWIVNPNDRNISVFVLNEQGKYQLQGMYAGDMAIKPTIFDNLNINLKDIFKS